MAAKRAGVLHVPTLWYYDALSFVSNETESDHTLLRDPLEKTVSKNNHFLYTELLLNVFFKLFISHCPPRNTYFSEIKLFFMSFPVFKPSRY